MIWKVLRSFRVGNACSTVSSQLQVLRQFSQHEKTLRYFLVNNEQRVCRRRHQPGQTPQVVSDGRLVRGHVSQEERTIVHAPKYDFGMISDEIYLNGAVVELHDHSGLIASPADNLRYDRAVPGTHPHLVDA